MLTYIENPVSHKYVAANGKGILIACLDISGYSSNRLPQNIFKGTS